VGVATVATPLSCTNPRHPSLGHGRIALSYSAGPLPYWGGLASHGNPFAGNIMGKAWVTLPSRPTVWLSMWLQPALSVCLSVCLWTGLRYHAFPLYFATPIHPSLGHGQMKLGECKSRFHNVWTTPA
jgi:hypothetical protein